VAARINLSIPDELKERMDKLTNVNWSKVAQEAFETKSTIVELRSQNMNQEAGLLRLRASRGNQTEHDRAEGLALGKDWALNQAEFEEVSRVVKLAEGEQQITAEAVNWAICDNDQNNFEDVFDDANASDAMAEGFVEGAKEIFIAV
jgi:hypothetical protein